jgi:hypothetical protein
LELLCIRVQLGALHGTHIRVLKHGFIKSGNADTAC